MPTDFAWLGLDRNANNAIGFIEVETDTGLIGYGVTNLADPNVIAQIINGVAGPAIVGMDALTTERVWHELYWTLTNAAQTGYATTAISAIDVALWDVKGQALGLPVWKLIGGARQKVEAYATIGVPKLGRDELVETGKRLTAMGFKALKIQVGRPGLDHRSGQKPLIEIIREDVRRIAALRAGVGPDIEIGIDAQCRLDLAHAIELVRRSEVHAVAFFEEPVLQNDPMLMADMRRRCAIPLYAGQNEGLAFRFRDLLVNQSVDLIQPSPNAAGGFTQCIRIAGLASSFNIPINGSGCIYHAMHLQAGVANGTTLEYQTNSATSYKMLFDNRPEPQDGWITLPDAPGLGVTPNLDAVKEFTQDYSKEGGEPPKSSGAGRADRGRRRRHEESPGKMRV